jgi:DNA mismatch repair ATPase MutS
MDWNHKVFGTHLRIPSKSIPHFRANFMHEGGGSGKKRARPVVGVIELGLRTDGLHVTTAGIAQASKAHQAAMSAYHDAQASIEHEVIATACTHWKSVSKLAETLALLDVLCSFAHVAANAAIPWTHPSMVEGTDNVIRIEQLRHPLVEAAVSTGTDSSAYVPNDVCFRRGDASTGPHVVLITGPNMGGKTTYMKSIAVSIILAQIGSFVPASAATLGLTDAMFAKFSAKEDLLAGTSSFTAEMHDIASILQRVGPRSFTILDEIAQGTSTNDGMALASGIVNHLMAPSTGCTVIATHFHELADMAGSAAISSSGDVAFSTVNPPGTPAVSVHFDARLEHDKQGASSQLRFNYSVQLGACTRSMGLDVALAMGIPASIVSAARTRLSHDAAVLASTPAADETIISTQPDE